MPLYTVMPPTKTDRHGSNAATTDGRALALVRRIWSLRGLPLMPTFAGYGYQTQARSRWRKTDIIAPLATNSNLSVR